MPLCWGLLTKRRAATRLAYARYATATARRVGIGGEVTEKPDDSVSLGEARDWLRDRIDKGAGCPCCKQFAKVYPRRLYAAEGAGLIAMWRLNRDDWVKIPALKMQGGDLLKARFWDLIEPMPNAERADGSKRVGIWRLTLRGVDFVHGRTKVPRIARVYNNRCLGLDASKGEAGIRDVLGARFEYAELMGYSTE